MRGATSLTEPSAHSDNYFNPHTPCGVRLRFWTQKSHLLRFQSTHPMRGATRRLGPTHFGKPMISIHTPHAGCDLRLEVCKYLHILHFNPHTPCGVRLFGRCLDNYNAIFQSTHPMRGATFHTRLVQFQR